MAYDNPEVFGRFHLYERRGGRELGKYGREILVLAEVSGDRSTVHNGYLRALAVLGAYGAEVARVRVIHEQGFQAQTVGAEHLFFLPRADHEATVLKSMNGDNESENMPGGVRVTYDRKSSLQQLGPTGEVALQYDAFAEPPVLRVIDVQGHIEDGHGKWGEPRSDLPETMLPELIEAVAA